MNSPEPPATTRPPPTGLPRVCAVLRYTGIIVGLTLVCDLVALAVYAAGVYAWAPTPHDWPLLSSPDTLLIIMAGLGTTLVLPAASHLTHRPKPVPRQREPEES